MTQTLLDQIRIAGKGMPVNIEGRYETLSSERSGYLERAREYSRFTLPYVLPDGDDMNRGDAGNQHGFQSIGAQAVNHLSNKLSTNLFPIGRSFFKLDFEDEARAKLKKAGYEAVYLSELLVEAEDRCTSLQTKIAARVAYTEALKNLIISGNILMYLPADGFLQAIKLDRYVTSRDVSGNLLENIVLQRKAFNTFSEETKDIIKTMKMFQDPDPDEIVNLYTWVYRIDSKTFGIAQALNNVLIKSYQEIPADQMPFMPLRWNTTNGESYGRGHVEDNAGDIYVIEFLSEAIAKGMALMADVKYLIKPGSVTDIDEVSTAPPGEWVFGNLDDIGVLQLEKYADFTPIAEVLKEYKRRVGQAFLLNSAIRRDAERVTTVELRLDAQELETSLGGVYSLLAQTFQTPLAFLYLSRIGFPLAKDLVMPDIVTGLEAFGKAGDLDKLKQFTEMMQLPQAWPLGVQERVKWDIFARDIASKLSMKMDFMMDAEEWKAYQEAKAKQQQNQAMQDAMVRSAPQVAGQLGDKVIGGQ